MVLKNPFKFRSYIVFLTSSHKCMFCLQMMCSSCSLIFIMLLSSALLFTIIFLVEDFYLYMFYVYLILTNIFRFDLIFFTQPLSPS